MNIMKILGYLSLVVLLLLGGCKDDVTVKEFGGEGCLSVEFLTDKSVLTRAAEPVYALEIQKADGTLVERYNDIKGITNRIVLPAGTYKLVATCGDDVLSGFEKPYYKSEQEVKIEAAVTKEVSMICTQANVKVTVGYSDLIKNTFPEYSLQVANGEGNLTFEKNESRAGYLRVNEGTLTWNLTLHNGQEAYHLNKTITGVEPRQHYHFSFDIKENGSEEEGAFVGGVIVDTTTEVYNWLCEIVLKENIAKPTILRADNIALSESLLVLEEKRGADIQLNVTAQARMQNLTIRHKSAVVKEMGVPESFTLTDIMPENQASINNAGIIWGNETLLNSQQATINFSGLANKLPLGDYQFFVSVYDARNRLVTDTLRISVIPDMDHVAANINRYDIWAKFATISGQWYTIDCPEGMTFEYSSDQTSWISVDQQNILFNNAAKTMTVCLTNLTPGTVYYYRTVSNAFTSDQIKTFTTEEAVVVPYLNFDNWYSSGKSPMVGESADNIVWDSGNKGGAGFGFIPTTQEKTDVIRGSAVKLESMYAVVKFAAGNLYTGSFGGTYNISQARINFGIPYTGRPTTLSGYYKYIPQTVNRGNQGGMNGKQDSCHIYIALLDWTAPHVVDSGNSSSNMDLSSNNKSIIAFGEVKDSRVMADYEHFVINLDYRNKEKIPSYILIVATASKYGDYFTGAEGSVLWIDEFEFGFDPVQ